MSEWTIYHNARCSKSRQTLALLRDNGIEPVIVDYLAEPPSAAVIAGLVKLLGIRAAALVRTKEARFKELGLPGKELSEADWCQTLAANPKLLERPIVVRGNRAVIGRPPDNVLTLT